MARPCLLLLLTLVALAPGAGGVGPSAAVWPAGRRLSHARPPPYKLPPYKPPAPPPLPPVRGRGGPGWPHVAPLTPPSPLVQAPPPPAGCLAPLLINGGFEQGFLLPPAKLQGPEMQFYVRGLGLGRRWRVCAGAV